VLSPLIDAVRERGVCAQRRLAALVPGEAALQGGTAEEDFLAPPPSPN